MSQVELVHLSWLWCQGTPQELWDHLQDGNAYYRLRLERTDKMLVGVRAKRAAEAAAEEKHHAK